jgi:hypothetical protein
LETRSERTGATSAHSTPRSRGHEQNGAEAVRIGAQANMWDPEKGAAHQAGYEPFVQGIASLRAAV